MALYLKHKVHALKIPLLLKTKCYPSPEPSVSHNLFADNESCLNVEGCWQIRVVVAEGRGGCGNFLK